MQTLSSRRDSLLYSPLYRGGDRAGANPIGDGVRLTCLTASTTFAIRFSLSAIRFFRFYYAKSYIGASPRLSGAFSKWYADGPKKGAH